MTTRPSVSRIEERKSQAQIDRVKSMEELIDRIDEMGLDDPMIRTSSIGSLLDNLRNTALEEKTNRIV